MGLQQRLIELEQKIFVRKPGPGPMTATPTVWESRGIKYLRSTPDLRESFENILARVANKNAVLLDIMCGAGKVVMGLRRRGIVAFGVDARSYNSWAAMPEQVIHADVKDLSFIKPSSMDVVLSVWGIEGTRHPFDESLKVLKLGGLAFYYPFGILPPSSLPAGYGMHRRSMGLIIERYI